MKGMKMEKNADREVPDLRCSPEIIFSPMARQL
jgi:hypothetical protein